MPVLGSSAYVSVESAANLIRAIVGDMIYSSTGEIITDTSPYLLVLLNDTLQWFGEECANHGIDTFEKETILTPFTAVTGTPSTDPATQVNVSDTGYFDGNINHATPQLPTDLTVPLKLWERQTGSQEDFIYVSQQHDGLPSQVPTDRFGIWEWREDGIYLPGAIQSNDIRLRYRGVLAQLVTVEDILYFRGAVGPIAYKFVSIYEATRKPELAEAAGAEAMLRMNQLFTRNARMKQRTAAFRKSYGQAPNNRRFFPPRNP